MSKTAIVIPCYNEEKRLPQNDFSNFITENDIHFCFINDGSSDETASILNQLKSKHSNKIQVINNKVNKGKAAVIRQAVLELLEQESFDFIGYFDADLATPLSEIETLLKPLRDRKEFEFSLGSRVLRLGVKIERSALRHYLSRVFATLASKTVKMPVYDTQCGAKIIKTKLAKHIFQEPFISKWLFDVELLARVVINKNNDEQPFIEVPLNEWVEKGGSKIKLKDVILFPLELLKIKLKYF